MAKDSCDPRNRWPQKNDCELKNLRPRNNGTGIVFRTAKSGVEPLRYKNAGMGTPFRTANAGLHGIFRRGMPVEPAFRSEYHCEVPGEFVLTPLYNERRQYVYNENGVLVFCVVKVV